MSYQKRSEAEWAWAQLGNFCHKFTVDPVSGCWLWGGALGNGQKRQYGMYLQQAAHRWAWEAFEGPIPEGMTVDHLCRRVLCVNTNHLELVDGSENSRRGIRFRMALATLYQGMWEEPDCWTLTRTCGLGRLES